MGNKPKQLTHVASLLACYAGINLKHVSAMVMARFKFVIFQKL